MNSLKSKTLTLSCLAALFWSSPVASQGLATRETGPRFEPAVLLSLLQQPPQIFGENLPVPIVQRTAEFMAINRFTPEFAGKVPYVAQPIHAHGIHGVAYYEVWFTTDGVNPEGWLLLSVTDADYPAVNFSHNGTPYSLRVRARAANNGRRLTATDKFYRFGVSYFTLESATGELLGDYGQMPLWLVRPNGAQGSGKGDSEHPEVAPSDVPAVGKDANDTIAVEDYAALRRLFPGNYFTAQRAHTASEMRTRLFPASGHGEASTKDNYYIYRYIASYSNQALYTQIPANYRYNWASCWSGCNNNAWTGLYAWWDKNLGKSNLIATTSGGETCPTYRNTNARQDVVDPVQMYFRAVCGTYCGSGTGWTYWSNAYLGFQFASARGYGYSYWYQWCNSTGCNVNLANILVDSIGNNARPAHVGANSHFYIGTGLAQWATNTDWTWVYGYPGWREDHADDVWIWWHDVNTATRVYVY